MATAPTRGNEWAPTVSHLEGRALPFHSVPISPVSRRVTVTPSESKFPLPVLVSLPSPLLASLLSSSSAPPRRCCFLATTELSEPHSIQSPSSWFPSPRRTVSRQRGAEAARCSLPAAPGVKDRWRGRSAGGGGRVTKGTLELYDRTRHKDLPAAEVRCATSTTVLFGSFVRRGELSKPCSSCSSNQNNKKWLTA